MDKLKIFSAANQQLLVGFQSHDEVSIQLQGIGVRFEKWQASQPLSAAATQDEVI